VSSQPRPIDREHDLPAVADLVGRTRANGGLSHPGGQQWWLRELWRDERDDFGAYVWSDGDRAIDAYALVDGFFIVMERADGGPTAMEQIEWLEGRLRELGRPSIGFHGVDGDPLLPLLEARGYGRAGVELELLADVAAEPVPAPVPDGFRIGSLLDVSDATYIEGHRAAWSDQQPSSYRQALHDVVKAMPQFRADLVTVVLAPDGRVAACCIGWMDERSATLEIEPLGTHRDFRRLGLAHAVVKEIQHRAWASGARQVLVWNSPETNPAAYKLYTGAGMRPNRTLIELLKEL
jgi:ribosomal protein S18 acetylase RimI-like enzyme